MMRKIVSLVLIVSMFTSCGLIRKSLEKLDEENAAGYDKKLGTAIIKVDSSIVPYDAVKIKSPLFGKSKFIVDGNLEIPMKEVLAYQTASTFYTYTSLCGWTTRRIELAPISSYQGSYTSQEYRSGSGPNNAGGGWRSTTKVKNYLQKGNGELVFYTPGNLQKLVSNHAPSVDLLDEYFKRQKSLRNVGWLNTVGFVAGFIMTGTLKKDATGQSVAGVHNYVGLGLMSGTIVYGFVNRSKKKKNYSKVTESLEEYNSYFKRRGN